VERRAFFSALIGLADRSTPRCGSVRRTETAAAFANASLGKPTSTSTVLALINDSIARAYLKEWIDDWSNGGIDAVARTLGAKLAERFSIQDYGGIDDGKRASGGSITESSKALTVTGAAFTPTDVGKLILVPGAGASGRDLHTTIAGFADAKHVTLTTVASTSVSGKVVIWGTDNTHALRYLIARCKQTIVADSIELNRTATNQTALVARGLLPHTTTGRYLISDEVNISVVLNLQADDGVQLIQCNSTRRTLYGFNAGLNIENISFVGGTTSIDIWNDNTDGRHWKIRNCKFRLTSDFSIKLRALQFNGIHYGPPTDEWPVTSTDALIDRCDFINCKKALLTFCDETAVQGGRWQPVAGYFDANTAYIESHGNLSMDSVVAIASRIRPRASRWIDHYGYALRISKCRFGGEGEFWKQ
jgi:hypothetical protein